MTASWEVFAIDLGEVLETFTGPNAENEAREYADRLDALALRCYARIVPGTEPPITDREWELGR